MAHIPRLKSILNKPLEVDTKAISALQFPILLGAYAFNLRTPRINLASGSELHLVSDPTAGPSLITSEEGIVARFTKSALSNYYEDYSAINWNLTSVGLSGFARVKFRNLVNSSREWLLSNRDSVNRGWSWHTGLSATGSPPNRTFPLGFTHQSIAEYATATLVSGMDNVFGNVGFSHSGPNTNVRLFANGSLIEQIAVGNYVQTTLQGLPLRIAAQGFSTSQMSDEDIAVAYIFLGVLSDGHHAWLNSNPYGLLKVKERRRLVTVQSNIIQPAIISSTAQFFVPKFIGQIAASRIESSSQFFTHKINTVISTSRIESSIQFFNPALDGQIAIPQIASAVSLFGPTISGRISAAHISSTLQLFAPTLIAGELPVIALPFISSTLNFYAPKINGLIKANFLNSTSQIFTLTIDGLVKISNRIESAGILYAPKLNTIIKSPLIGSTLLLYAPKLMGDIKLNRIESVSSIYSPNLIAGNIIGIPRIESTSIIELFIVSGIIKSPFISSGSILFTPRVKPDIAVSFLPSSIQIYLPILRGNIKFPNISSTVSIFQPRIYNPNSIEISRINSTLSLFNPTLYAERNYIGEIDPLFPYNFIKDIDPVVARWLQDNFERIKKALEQLSSP